MKFDQPYSNLLEKVTCKQVVKYLLDTRVTILNDCAVM